MSIYDSLENIAPSEKGTYFQPGMYTVKINRVLEKASRKSGDLFIVECLISETSNESDHPVGSKASWCQKLIDPDIAKRALCHFGYAVLGYDWARDIEEIKASGLPKEIGKLLRQAVEKNAFEGKEVKLRASLGQTKDGRAFTKHEWMPVEDA